MDLLVMEVVGEMKKKQVPGNIRSGGLWVDICTANFNYKLFLLCLIPLPSPLSNWPPNSETEEEAGETDGREGEENVETM